MLTYNWFSRVKNWPPEVVDRLSLEQLEWFPVLEEASAEVSDRLSKENQAQNGK
jgi:hypothetical protein